MVHGAVAFHQGARAGGVVARGARPGIAKDSIARCTVAADRSDYAIAIDINAKACIISAVRRSGTSLNWQWHNMGNFHVEIRAFVKAKNTRFRQKADITKQYNNNNFEFLLQFWVEKNLSAADGFPQACLSLMSDEVMATALAGACWELTLESGSASLCHVSKCSVKQACSISHQVRVISLQATQQRTTIELRQPSTDGFTINRSLLFGLLYDNRNAFSLTVNPYLYKRHWTHWRLKYICHTDA